MLSNRGLWSGCVGVLACLASAGTATFAATITDAEAQALFEPPGLKQRVADGVVSRNMLQENTRRALLLQRCSAGKSAFPRQHVEGVEAVLAKAEAWAFQGDRSLVTKHYDAAEDLRAVTTSLARASLTPSDLDSWRSFRKSAEGERSARLMAMALAIHAVGKSGATVDTMSGVRWDWPFARLRQLADDLSLRSEFDSTLNRTVPGSARVVARVSDNLVDSAGTTPETDRLAQALESGLLADAWLDGLSSADSSALQRYGSNPVALRWGQTIDAFQGLLVQGGDLPSTCKRVGVSACEAGGAIDTEIKAVQARLRDHTAAKYGLRDLEQLVKKVPAAGCQVQ
jgi:hypothetical protein